MQTANCSLFVIHYLATMFLTILLWLFKSAVVIQCFYALGIFIRIFSLPKYKQTPPSLKKPVTVIICAKDEAANLRRHLPQIMAQRYTNEAGKPLFEVIVVNDCSKDDTEQVLQELEQQYDNLWHVTISAREERRFPGKKFALSRGVEHAANELLLLIDADCAPVSDRWMELMVAPLNEGKEIAAGYGKYRSKGTLLNAFTCWETLHTFLQYSTFTLVGYPYMAVGRNLACTKSILLKAQATEVWNKLPSGDDDLLISTMATKENMAIVSNNQSFTRTGSKETWGEWLSQKQRHMSTGKYYKTDVKNLLGLYAFSHMLLWLSFFAILFISPASLIIWMVIRCVLYWLIWSVAAIRLQEESLILLFPLFDIGWMIYNFVFSPYILLKNKTQWK